MKRNTNIDVSEWDHYNIANNEHAYYKIALLNAIPLVDKKGEEKLILINSKEFRRFIAYLIHEGRFVEAKDILSLSKRASQKSIEQDLYTVVPLSLRIGYPYYIKVMLKALKEETSASAILRRVILEEVDKLMEELSTTPNVNKELVEKIKNQTRSLAASIKEKRRDQTLFEWEGDSLDNTTKQYFNEFIYDAIIVGLQKEGLNPEIFKLMMPEKPKDPYIDIEGEIAYKADTKQFVLRIHFLVLIDLDWEWDYYIYEYSRLALENFDPKEILKFHQATGLPGFKGMSIRDIKELKEKMQEMSRDDFVRAVFRNDSELILGNILAAYSEDPENLFNFMDDWESTFIPKVLSIEIPIKLNQNGVVIADTLTPLTDFKEVTKYIFNTYRERFDIKDVTLSDDLLNSLTLEETEKTLWMLAFREAALKVSEIIAKLISKSLPKSEVMKTSVPRIFPKLLETFRGKTLREILEKRIEETEV